MLSSCPHLSEISTTILIMLGKANGCPLLLGSQGPVALFSSPAQLSGCVFSPSFGSFLKHSFSGGVWGLDARCLLEGRFLYSHCWLYFHCYCWFYLVNHQELVCDCSGMIMWYINTYIKVWLFSELFVPIFIKQMDLQETAIALREAIIWSIIWYRGHVLTYMKTWYAHPKEYVFGRVKSCSKNSGCIWCIPVTDNAACKPGNSTLGDLSFIAVLAAGNCICYNKIYGALCWSANLKELIVYKKFLSEALWTKQLNSLTVLQTSSPTPN